MKTIVDSKTMVWFGVYKKFYILGFQARSLEKIEPSLSAAKDALALILKEQSWHTANDFMIEEVDVGMRAWKEPIAEV